MADPLSIAAGIAGLITLADIVIERTYKTIVAFKTSSKDAQRLILEVQSLAGILKGLQALEVQVSSAALQAKIPSDLRYECQRMLERLIQKLQDADPNSAKSRVRRMEKIVKWPFHSDEFRSTLLEIERFKTAFNLATSIQTLEEVLSSSNEQIEIAADVRSIRDHLCRIEINQQRKDILEFFGTYASESSHEMSVKLRLAGTGLWLTESKELESWLCTANSKLWLYGIPGAGKTVLAGAVITEILDVASPDVALGYYYCDYRKDETRELKSVLASLAGQLATQDQACFELLQKLYQPTPDSVPLRIVPDEDVLIQLLLKMARHFNEVAIVVDALDECNREHMTAKVLADLADSSERNIKMMLVSRDHAAIRQHLLSFEAMSIAAHNSDLRLFVSSQIEHRAQTGELRLRSPELKADILEQLSTRAEGMSVIRAGQ